jgi:hypothetical protein
MSETIIGQARVFIDVDKKLTVRVMNLDYGINYTWKAPHSLPLETKFTIIPNDKTSKDNITGVDLINSLQAILSNYMGCKLELSESMCEDIAKQFPNKSDKTIDSKKTKKGATKKQSW